MVFLDFFEYFFDEFLDEFLGSLLDSFFSRNYGRGFWVFFWCFFNVGLFRVWFLEGSKLFLHSKLYDWSSFNPTATYVSTIFLLKKYFIDQNEQKNWLKLKQGNFKKYLAPFYSKYFYAIVGYIVAHRCVIYGPLSSYVKVPWLCMVLSIVSRRSGSSRGHTTQCLIWQKISSFDYGRKKNLNSSF